MSSNPKARKPHPKPKKPLLPWKGVFALEGDWSEDNLADRTSVVPVLETLERLQIIDYVRRDIGTRAELERYLRRWRDELPDYRVLYLGFHGDVTAEGQRALWISDRDDGRVSVDHLAGLLAQRLEDCVVYFGSCSIMTEPKQRLEAFVTTTGALAVMGYTTDIEWVDSAAFYMIALSWLATYKRLHVAIDKIESEAYKSLRKALGFTIVRRP